MAQQIPPQTTLDLFLEIVAELKADFATANTESSIASVPRDDVTYHVEDDLVVVAMTPLETFCLDAALFGPDVALKLLDYSVIDDAQSNSTAKL